MAMQNKDGTYSVRLTEAEYLIISRIIGHNTHAHDKIMYKLYGKLDHNSAVKLGPVPGSIKKNIADDQDRWMFDVVG